MKKYNDFLEQVENFLIKKGFAIKSSCGDVSTLTKFTNEEVVNLYVDFKMYVGLLKNEENLKLMNQSKEDVFKEMDLIIEKLNEIISL